MRIIEDAIRALNFKYIGTTLSKRSAGMVAGTFAFLVIVYTIVFGLWYGAITGEFIDAFLEISKPYLPSFGITTRTRTSSSW